MSTYTKKVRKPIRSALIALLAKVDDPKVQIISGEMDVQTDPLPQWGDCCITYARSGYTDYTLTLRIYDPAADDFAGEKS